MTAWPYAHEVGCATPNVIPVLSVVLAVIVVIGAIGCIVVISINRMRPWRNATTSKAAVC